MNDYQIKQLLPPQPGTAAVFLRGEGVVELDRVWGLGLVEEEQDGAPCYQVVVPLCAPPAAHGWGPTVLLPAIFIEGYAGMCTVSKRAELPRQVKLTPRGLKALPPKVLAQVQELLEHLELWKIANEPTEDEPEAKVYDIRPRLRVVSSRKHSAEAIQAKALARLAETQPDMCLRDALACIQESEGDDG